MSTPRRFLSMHCGHLALWLSMRGWAGKLRERGLRRHAVVHTRTSVGSHAVKGVAAGRPRRDGLLAGRAERADPDRGREGHGQRGRHQRRGAPLPALAATMLWLGACEVIVCVGSSGACYCLACMCEARSDSRSCWYVQAGQLLRVCWLCHQGPAASLASQRRVPSGQAEHLCP